MNTSFMSVSSHLLAFEADTVNALDKFSKDTMAKLGKKFYLVFGRSLNVIPMF